MSSASSSEDEFEQFRARTYSGGNIISLQQLREEIKHGQILPKQNLCPADEDSSDSDDGQERSGRASDKQQHSKNENLKVPRTYRSRSLSPNYASTIAARNRARLRAEQLRQLLAKYSQGSQDEPVVSKNISPTHTKVVKKRSFDICFPQTYTEQQESQIQQAGGSDVRLGYRRRSDADRLHNNNSTKHVHPTRAQDENSSWNMGEMRPRVSSMPSGTVTKRPSCRKAPSIHSFGYDTRNAYVIREFELTSKGNVINKRSYLSQSNTSVDSGSTTASATSLVEGPYSVYLMGIPGVGIRALISTFIAEQLEDTDSGDEDGEKSVSVLLDGEEATMHFIDVSDDEVAQFISSQKADAYVIVYSVEDRESFEGAVDRLYTIRNDDPRSVAVILVANKMDLVRNRIVQDDEGRSAAKNYDCKFIEVSAAIDHKVDDLLVGILKQIRLIKERNESAAKGKHKHRPKLRQRPDETCCLLRAKQNVLGRLLRSGKYASRSCDNLYVL